MTGLTYCSSFNAHALKHKRTRLTSEVVGEDVIGEVEARMRRVCVFRQRRLAPGAIIVSGRAGVTRQASATQRTACNTPSRAIAARGTSFITGWYCAYSFRR